MKSISPIKLINLQDGYHLFVSARINGKKAVLIIDTGASRSAFDIKRMKKFVPEKKFRKAGQLASGIGTNSMKSQIACINSLCIGKVKMENYFAVLLDFSHVMAAYDDMGIQRIDGILGSDILNMFSALIDYRKKKLILFTK